MRLRLKSWKNADTVGIFGDLVQVQLWMKTKSHDNITWSIVGPDILAGYRIFDSRPIVYLHIEEGPTPEVPWIAEDHARGEESTG